MSPIRLEPVLALVMLTAACAHRKEASAEASYVNPALCAGCHTAQWESFRHTGMGRSFYRATPDQMREDFSHTATFYHKPSDRYYQMLRRGDSFFIRRYQKDEHGGETNAVEARIDYVMGSGNHARTYIHRTGQNRLVELPVTWYPGEQDKPGFFAMSPGYDRADHMDFRRKIGYDCFFCHDAYPDLTQVRDDDIADPVYPAQLPEGIDCQRCHGPGSAHVDAAQRQRPVQEIRRAIVNPAHLSPERQLEVCMQCHLETTSFVLPGSIQRYGRGTFSFRPGEPLADYMLYFDHSRGTGHDDKFEIVSAAYRLRQSACFQKSGGALLCTTCHDPHRTSRAEQASAQYTAACLKCHREKLLAQKASGRHPDARSCIACHMPKRRTEDVVQAVMTDHWIQRRPATNLLAPILERHDIAGVSYRGEVILYYPASLPSQADRELYVAAAQVAQKSNLEAGAPRLESALRAYHPRQAEFYAALAEALMATDKRSQGIAMYEAALERDPRFLPALRALGAALAQSGETSRAIAALERARSIDPEDAATLHELGLAYRDSGRGADAVSALRAAISRDPDLPEIRNSLGNLLLEMGDRDGAEESLREAVRSQPDFAAAHADLGNALAAAGDVAGAERQYRIATQLDPANSAAHYGLGAALASGGRFDEAQKQLEEAVKLSPDMAPAQAILGDLDSRRGDWHRAIARYQEALRIKPDFGRAHLGLGTALAETRDLIGARQHLTLAAQDADPAIRQEALEVLREIAK